MKEEALSHEENLRVIKQMMAELRSQLANDSFHFMLWGILVSMASLLQFSMLRMGVGPESNWVWLGMSVLGIIGVFWYESRGKKHRGTESQLRRANGFLWMSVGITIAVVIFLALANGNSPIPFILATVGLATFLSGCLDRFSWLIIGGIVLWSGAIVAVFLPHESQLLVNALAIFLGYVVPAIRLRQSEKKRGHV